MYLATKTIRSVQDLKQLVSDYEAFDEFAFDVETKANRHPRQLEALTEVPKAPTRNPTRPEIPCPACGRYFYPRYGRKTCSDPCRLAAEKDKPALDARTNLVWCIGLAGPGRADVIPCGHPDQKWKQFDDADVFDALEPLFFSDRRKINQNVGFDLTSIAKYYDEEIPPPPYGDVLTLAFLLNENLLSYKLGDLSAKYHGYRYDPKKKLGERAYEAPFEVAVRYCLIDAKNAWMLWWKMRPKLSKPGLRKLRDLFDLEMDVLNVLMDMRQTGAYVDHQAFVELRPLLEQRVEQARANVIDLIGTDWPDKYEVQRNEINLNSTQKLSQYFYDVKKLPCPKLTEKGARSVDASSLAILAKRSPVAKAMLEYRDYLKMESTYISGYIPHIDDDERIRASFNQARAKTGRLSCSDPNLQNIPARYKATFESTMVRKLFKAPPGKKLVVADYSQIELRILAHQTRDAKLLYAYTHGEDLHTQTAALIWRIPHNEVTPHQRSIAKNSNFNFAFEGGPMRVVDMSGIGLREAEQVYEAWHRAYPGVKKWADATKKSCWDHGYVETLFGRKRRLPEISSDDWKIRSYAQRQAVNHPIQGTAADIAKVAIVQVHEALYEYDAALVLQIHDEFVIEVAERQVDEVVPLVRSAMEDIRLGDDPVLTVPLEVNIGVGNNWAECK